MSYDIVRSIKVDDEKQRVIITAAANNVTPRTYHPHDSQHFANLWAEKGKEAVEIELVKAFESGNFQGGSSKYKEAAERLRKMPEYQNFDWRRGGLGDEFVKISDHRREAVAEFDALVLRALKAKKPKTKFVLRKEVPFYGLMYFNARSNARRSKWFKDQERAKVYAYREDAENERKCWIGGEEWEVLQIA